MNQVFYKKITTPIGEIILVATDKGICWLGGISRFNQKKKWIQKVTNTQTLIEDNKYSLIMRAEAQLKEYFLEKLTTFTVPLDLHGTDFQRKVWSSIAKIPFGQTITYTNLAISVDNPQAIRAIGTICGQNPVILLIPCHRVIGSKGKLTGFVEGIEKKQFLLKLENPPKQAKLF